MPSQSQTTERAFESYVEEILLTRGGWKSGTNAEWDKERALFPAKVFAFIQETQEKLWREMRTLHAAGLEALLLTALVKEFEAKGSLHILRHGFKFYGKTFRLAYFKPAHGANYEVLELFSKNRLTVTRQVPCHPGDNRTLDMVLAVNGLPVATIEVKNPGTGQNWRHAVRQYKEDRDPRAPLFDFKKRALVHFAADSEEIHMTTRLEGDKTHFLPFNRGSHPGQIKCGAGNPQHVSGYRTGYFWEDVLQFESFLDIFGHFLFLEKKEEKVDDGRGGHRWMTKETMIFPRITSSTRCASWWKRRAAKGRGGITLSNIPPAAGRRIAFPGSRIGSQACMTRRMRRFSIAWWSSPTGRSSTSNCRTQFTRSNTRRAW